jgi:hypothetical protein
MTKASKWIQFFNEVIKDDDDRWRVSIDDHDKSFIVYRGSDEICTGSFNPVTNVEFTDTKYQKNNMIKTKAMEMVKKTFGG